MILIIGVTGIILGGLLTGTILRKVHGSQTRFDPEGSHGKSRND